MDPFWRGKDWCPRFGRARVSLTDWVDRVGGHTPVARAKRIKNATKRAKSAIASERAKPKMA